MKPVMQTLTMPPLGNCFQASLASVFEVPLEAVPATVYPDFVDDDGHYDLNAGWPRYRARLHEQFLHPRNLQLVSVAVNSSPDFVPLGWSLLAVSSPKIGFMHSVVCFNGEIAHDPYPWGDTPRPSYQRVEWDMLCVLDPRWLTRLELSMRCYDEICDR